MKNWPIVIVVLLSLVLAGSISCGEAKTEEQDNTQKPTGQEDSRVIVNGIGNIEVLNELELSFGFDGRIEKVYVDDGDEVTAGAVLAKIETNKLELALAQAQVALVQAEVAQAQAQVGWDQARAAQTQAQINLSQTQADYSQAQANYSQAQAGQAQAQITLDVAEDELDDAEDLLDRVLDFFSKTDSKVKDAQAWFDRAELQFEAAVMQLEAAKAQIQAANARLQTAQGQLEATDQQFDITASQLTAAHLRIELAKAQVSVSKLSVAEAQRQLDEATITAPFDGIVTSVAVQEGDTISAMNTVLQLIDPDSMELNVEVDEIDVTKVKEGQKATVEVDSLPGILLDGVVRYISPIPAQRTGIKTYDVKIILNYPEGSNLRVGMSATADILISE